MRIDVDAERDSAGELSPVRLGIGARTVAVLGILDRWPAPGHLYVKLAGADGATYIVRHETASGHWDLVMFDAPQSPTRRA